MSGSIHILGPQQPSANLPTVVANHIPDGPMAIITAGWRLDESDISALERDLKAPLFLLPLYTWFDFLGSKEPDLAGQHAARQNKIKAYKKIYNLQLQSACDLWTKISDLKQKNNELYEIDEHDACETVRQTDRRCIERQNAVRKSFPDLEKPWSHFSAAPYYKKIEMTLQKCSGLIIAGGHVAVLRNRMYFFGLNKLLPEFLDAGKSIITWSAGAMSLSEQIVLYYDDPPDNDAGLPKVLDKGLGLIPNTIFLPHARQRLHIDTPKRVTRFARRFLPAKCIALEHGAHLQYQNNNPEPVNHSEKGSCYELHVDGTTRDIEGGQ